MRDSIKRTIDLEGDDIEKLIIEKFGLSQNHNFEWSSYPDSVQVTDYAPKPGPLNKPAGYRRIAAERGAA